MKIIGEPSAMGPFALFVCIAGAILVGGSGTFLVQHLLAPAETPRLAEDSTASAALDPRLAEAMIQLAQELRASRSSLSTGSAPSLEPAQRRVATESGDSAMVELAAAVRELRAALAQAGGSSAAAATLPPLTRPSREQRAWLAELSSEVADRETAYSRQHMFWSEQQILEKYGMPDSINVRDNGVAMWAYQDPDEDKRSFYVYISQGRVIQVEGP